MAKAEPRREAHAPYNFIPLPETIVAAQTPLPRHDRYDTSRFTGRFEVTLTTETPLFVRGMLTRDEALLNSKDKAYKNKPDFFQLSESKPIIPGSSLRGMLSSLVEIITFSKMRRVSDTPKIYYRAVAAKSDDPLGQYYEQVAGKLGVKVQAGYLKHDGDKWFVQPAAIRAKKSFVKVRDLDKTGKVVDSIRAITGLIHLNDKDYKVQYFDVMLNGSLEETKSGLRVNVRLPNPEEHRDGVLVCTGNMAESDRSNRRTVATERRNFTLVFERDECARPVPVSPQAVKDYLDGLTPFQTEEPFDKKLGCLIAGRPVFYVPDSQTGMIHHFGHAPFSRIAAMHPYLDERGKNQQRAVTPRDLIPPSVQDNPMHYDMTEALFGYINKGGKTAVQGEIENAYASRVWVADALPLHQAQAFFEDEFSPKILSGPKPTTFQHYLEQPDGVYTDKLNLRHYARHDAQIRGYKVYWRQSRINIEEIRETDQAALRSIAEGGDTQHTRIRPLKSGISFTFQVHFENLSAQELGALAWALMLPGNERHRHQIGMGKPYGMGVIRCHPVTLLLSNRLERYLTLLEPQRWYEAENQASVKPFIEAFEAYVSDALPQSGTFRDQPRIRELFTMLELHGPQGDTFKYMTIEPNQYKERLVLPYPSEVFKSANPSDAKLGTAHPQAQQAEYKPPKSSRQQLATRGPQVGDNIRGKVLDNEGDLLFTPEEYPQCEAVIPKEKINKKRKVDEVVKAIIVEVHFESEPILLICEQIIPEQHKP